MNKLNRLQLTILVIMQCAVFSSSITAAPSAAAKKTLQQQKASIARRVKINGWKFNQASSSELRVLGSD